MAYQPTNHVRVVTATSLFDGHDATINIMRRILQATGVEVIHLGHDRSAADIVKAAVEEDTQAVAITSYQGGHMEFFRYVRQLLDEAGAASVKIFGGGGGTILPAEGEELERSGIARIYSPDDGRRLGLQGMIDDLVAQADFPVVDPDAVYDISALTTATPGLLGRMVSAVEHAPDGLLAATAREAAARRDTPIVGITGTGGAGKSSLVDEMIVRFLADFPGRTVGVVSVDPSQRRSGGALLGDRIRMNSIDSPRVYMRSLATRQANLALSPHVATTVALVKAAGYDLIILETSGIGQADTEIVDHSDLSVYVMTPEYGAASQLEKIDMLDFADLVVINKADRRGAEDALRDVRKQYKRNHQAFDTPDEELPVYPTVASHFNDAGTNRFYQTLVDRVATLSGQDIAASENLAIDVGGGPIVPKDRVRYLSEIAQSVRTYNEHVDRQAERAIEAQAMTIAATLVDEPALVERRDRSMAELDPDVAELLDRWDGDVEAHRVEHAAYEVRGKTVEVDATETTLSGTEIPKVAPPRLTGWGDRVRWAMQENYPGRFPYTAGVFPYRRTEEDPTRMFAGEGGPEQTNRRFHYLSADTPAKRLSTAFDSVTLYGHDPDERPDIFGKVGNSGVSVATLDDAKKLYSGFDLVDPATSVSMTINGPAPMLLGFFLNVAIDQQVERYVIAHGLEGEVEGALRARYEDRGVERPRYHGELPAGNDGLGLMLLGLTGDEVVPPEVYDQIKSDVLSRVRGTVQADILKEDQAQNTSIFSTEFGLRMQGDIQEYFNQHRVRNFYSMSISGYHMAEAGANPITQLAFTLANGFTFVEYFRSRGMPIDSFAPNLSFFFSNGIDAEYAVIGRVARRIWAKAMRHVYAADDRSQKLKYHIQTSGRSLHAQEISFNDIRTTLQALYAIYDNANSLHTNAYDEAITTPTEESVRRAMAIQLIINRELGLAKNENPLQGSFIIEELTDLVEEAVLAEFDRLTDRGGVLGAMERMYQRSKIQEESLLYERMKLSGELPIVGVNTFLSAEGSPFVIPDEIIRSTGEDKQRRIEAVRAFQERNAKEAELVLARLQKTALEGGNTFEALMEATKVASLGQLAHALYEVGGRYRRNM
jgi:isobutyryl-CoA mutase